MNCYFVTCAYYIFNNAKLKVREMAPWGKALETKNMRTRVQIPEPASKPDQWEEYLQSQSFFREMGGRVRTTRSLRVSLPGLHGG